MVVTFSGVVPPNSHPAPHFRWHDMIIQPMTSKGSQLAWVPEAPASVYTLSWNTYYVFFCQAKELTVTVDSPWGGRNQQGGFDMDVNAETEEISSRGLGWSLEGWKGGEMRHLVGYNQGFRVSLELVINIQVILEEPNIAQETKGMFCSPISNGSNFKFQPGWFLTGEYLLLVRVLFQVYPQVILCGCPFLGIPISCFARIILDHWKPYRWPLRLGAASFQQLSEKSESLQKRYGMPAPVGASHTMSRKKAWLVGFYSFFVYKH